MMNGTYKELCTQLTIKYGLSESRGNSVLSSISCARDHIVLIDPLSLHVRKESARVAGFRFPSITEVFEAFSTSTTRSITMRQFRQLVASGKEFLELVVGLRLCIQSDQYFGITCTSLNHNI